MRHGLGAYSWVGSLTATGSAATSGGHWLVPLSNNPFQPGEFVAILKEAQKPGVYDVLQVIGYSGGNLELAARSTGLNKASPNLPPLTTFWVLARWYECKLIVTSENLIDTAIRSGDDPYWLESVAPPVGLSLSMSAEVFAVAPCSFGDTMLRGNLIRHVDGQADPQAAKNSLGTSVMWAINSIVENNVINVEDGPASGPAFFSARRWLGGSVEVFNNFKTNGTMLRQYAFLANAANDDIVIVGFPSGFDANLLEEADMVLCGFSKRGNH